MKNWLEKNYKTLIIAGLDGDSNRKPFGQILECIPLCDNVVKLTAMDMIDKNGDEAIFSKRIVEDDNQISVGSTDKYIAVSRKNYLGRL
jgi:thymidine kinase